MSVLAFALTYPSIPALSESILSLLGFLEKKEPTRLVSDTTSTSLDDVLKGTTNFITLIRLTLECARKVDEK